jgi:hypothetical protein
VVDKLGSACVEKVQCSKLGISVDCVEKKCTSVEPVKKEGDIKEESGKLIHGLCLICSYFMINRLVK